MVQSRPVPNPAGLIEAKLQGWRFVRCSSFRRGSGLLPHMSYRNLSTDRLVNLRAELLDMVEDLVRELNDVTAILASREAKAILTAGRKNGGNGAAGRQ